MKSKQKTFIRTSGKKKNRFDNSHHPKKRQFYEGTNKKVIWKIEDEAASQIITGLIGLRSKMSSHVKDDGQNHKTTKAKG